MMADVTPRNWPISNVKISNSEAATLIAQAFPGSELTGLQELDKRKSFNNRIYFLNVQHPPSADHHLPSDIVLKIVGRFFDSRKVQNEVACLLLLEKYCPEIPIPRIVAWSEDGSKICGMRNGVFAVLHDPASIDSRAPDIDAHPWLMTTKLPGRILQTSELSANDTHLISQLADVFASWRTKIPPRVQIGNLALQPAGYTSSNDIQGLENLTSGILLTDTQPKAPLVTPLSYHQFHLSDQLHKYVTKPVFKPFKDRFATRLNHFAENILPNLPCYYQSRQGHQTEKEHSVFTHGDFAPRNILVSKSASGALIITGILDFEFAGFFPVVEDFLTEIARQEDDWPREFFDAFMKEVAERGVIVPGHGIDMKHFEMLMDVVKLTESVAPWYLQAEEGRLAGRELDDEIEKVSKVIEELLGRLERVCINGWNNDVYVNGTAQNEIDTSTDQGGG